MRGRRVIFALKGAFKVAVKNSKQKRYALLALLFPVILSCILSATTSLNRTERGHLGAAVYYYETAKNDVFCANPPLGRIVAGLPIFLSRPNYDLKSYSSRPSDRCEWLLGSDFMSANPEERTRIMIFLARLAFLPLILFGVWFGAKLAFTLYGFYGGLLFVLLWTFSPAILGWSATICPDVCAASMGLVGIYTLRKQFYTPHWRNATLAGCVLGLMFLTKLTWIVAVPIYVAIWFLWRWLHTSKRVLKNEASPSKTLEGRPRFYELLLLFGVSIYVLNMGYLFDGTFTRLRDFQFISGTLTGNPVDTARSDARTGNRFAGEGRSYETFLGLLPLPFPKDFVQGLDVQKYDFERGLESYLNGEFSSRGWRSYYLYVLLYKEPIGFAILFFIAIGTAFSKQYRLRKDEVIILVPAIALFLFISSQDGISIHPRYLLPFYPFVYLFICRVGLMFKRRVNADRKIKNKTASTLSRVLVVVALAYGVGSSLMQYPHSISYFNEFVGPQNGAKYLQGSNVDWGQNEYFFQNWLLKHHDLVVRTHYLTKKELERLEIDNVVLDDCSTPWIPGYYAVGIYDLYGKNKRFHAFQCMTPMERIGASIFIYRVTQADVDRMNAIPVTRDDEL